MQASNRRLSADAHEQELHDGGVAFLPCAVCRAPVDLIDVAAMPTAPALCERHQGWADAPDASR